MTNITALPQLPAHAGTITVDGDWLFTLFFAADTATPPTPLDLTGIRFKIAFKRDADEQVVLSLDTADGTIKNYGPAGYLSFQALVSTRPQLSPCQCSGYVFAIADGFQINLSEDGGPFTLNILSD